MYISYCEMSIIVCNSYRSQELNNFFLLFQNELFLFSNVLSRYIYRSFLLNKAKLFFLYFYNAKNKIIIYNLRVFLISVLYALVQSEINSYLSISLVLRYLYFFLNTLISIYKISFFYLIHLFNFFSFTKVYMYYLFFSLFNRNNGFGLPRKKHYETILRSPHGHKKSKEKFVKILYRRGLRNPSFFVTSSNILMNELFTRKKGVLVIHKYSIPVS